MSTSNFMHQSIRLTLRPFIRLILRYGIGYGEFAQVCKELYVDVAYNDFRIQKRKQTISRVSVLTGISRREIKHIQDQAASSQTEVTPFNHAARILASWINDPDFHDEKDQVAPLPISGEGSKTFNALVHKYGNNTPYRAILDELIRVGAVEVDEHGVARMVSMGYVPSKNSEQLLGVGLRSVADLINTIDFNDQQKPDISHLQMTVNYDNITDDGVEVFRQISQDKCKELLLFLNRFLATQDRDINPSIIGAGRNRAGIGIFYFEGKSEARKEPEPSPVADIGRSRLQGRVGGHLEEETIEQHRSPASVG